MSAYPPPPGSKSSSATPTPSNLPARPPPPAGGPRGFKPAFPATSQPGSHAASGNSGFRGFAPRAVTTGQPYRNPSPVVSAGPQAPSNYGGQATHNAGYQQGGYQQQGYYGQGFQGGFAGTTPPQIRNPFAPPTAGSSIGPTAGGYGAQPSVDPDMEAQIAQWQSAYVSKDDAKNARANAAPGAGSATGANSGPVGNRSEADTKGSVDTKPKTVQRTGGGQTWSDSTLLEWAPEHFRLFIGNLAGEVTDESLLKAFDKYTSVQKAKVIRDKRTTKSKGFGFISFSDGDDYFKAARDMQGKYIGSHPVLIKKSNTEIKPVTQRDPRHNNRKGGKSGGGGQTQGANGALGANTGAGIGKKAAKTKGGLKILG